MLKKLLEDGNENLYFHLETKRVKLQHDCFQNYITNAIDFHERHCLVQNHVKIEVLH